MTLNLETSHRFLAFADILGFRDLVRSSSLPLMTHLYRTIIERVAVSATAGGLTQVWASSLNMRLISDSVVMWTDTGHPASASI